MRCLIFQPMTTPINPFNLFPEFLVNVKTALEPFFKISMHIFRMTSLLICVVGCLQGCSMVKMMGDTKNDSLAIPPPLPSNIEDNSGIHEGDSSQKNSKNPETHDYQKREDASSTEISTAQKNPTAQPPSESSYYHYIQFERYNSKGQLNEALAALKQAIKGDPDALYLQKRLIFFYLNRKDEPKALAAAERLYKKYPTDSSVALLLAKLKQQQNQVDEARALYQQVLQEDATNRDVYIILGNMYLDSDDFDDAFRIFSRMADQFPTDYVPYFFLGRIHSEMENEEYAEKAFLRCLALKNDLVEPRFELIALYKSMQEEASGRRAGKYEKKIVSLYKEILEQEPHNLRATMALPIYYHQHGQRSKAATMFTQLAHDIQQKPTLLMLMANELIGNEEYESAALLFTEMLKRNGSGDALHFFAGLAFDGLKKSEEAIGHFLKISKNADQYKKAVIHVAFLYNEMGLMDTAIAFLEKKHEEMPRDIDIISYLAAMYEEKGMFKDALRILRRGLDFSPDNIEILFRSGVLLDKTGQKKACIQTMRKIIAQDPTHASALNYLGYTYAEMGENLDEAEEMVLKALEKKPDDGFITDSLGWVYYKKGMLEKAVEVLKKAEKLSSGDPLIIEHLGDVYVALNDFVKAKKAYENALAKSSDEEKIGLLEKKIMNMEKRIGQENE